MISLYVDDGLTNTQIAKIYGISRTTVRSRLVNAGIVMRDQSVKTKAELNALVKKMYLEDELSAKEIADKLDFSESGIRRKLSAMSITMRGCIGGKNSPAKRSASQRIAQKARQDRVRNGVNLNKFYQKKWV